MPTLAEARDDARAHLNEPAGRQNKMWANADLDRWIYEGLREVARRSEMLETIATVVTTAGLRTYAAPTDTVRIYRLEWTPDGNQVYPLEIRNVAEMDSVWLTQQSTQRAYPYYATFYGWPPNLNIYLFPVPSTNGTLNVWYYRLPARPAADSDLLEITAGWEDLIPLYVEFVARRQAGSDRWQEAHALFEARLGHHMDHTRLWFDQAGMISTGTSWVPGFIAMGDDWGW